MSPYYQQLRSAIGDGLLLVPSVAAVIRDGEGRLLLQEKQDGTWSLPAGAIEPGESPEEAVVREVLEETGMRCSVEEVLGVFGGEKFRYVYPHGDAVEYVIVLFRCEVLETSGPPTDDETKSLRYFSRNEFPGLALPYDIDLLFNDSEKSLRKIFP